MNRWGCIKSLSVSRRTRFRMFLWRLFSVLFAQKSRRDFSRTQCYLFLYTLCSAAVSSVRRSAGSTCHGISPGRRRHAREQIEVLMLYIIIIIILIFMRSAGLGSPWTLVSSPPVHNSRTLATWSIARVPYTNNCAIGRTRTLLWHWTASVL